MRDHSPIVIEEFNGFFQRGDPEACPPDHFSDCNNVQYTQSAVLTRDGVDVYLDPLTVGFPVRMYEYNSPRGEGLLILNTTGQIWHNVAGGTPVNFLVMTIGGMTDYGFVEINQRAFISPGI